MKFITFLLAESKASVPSNRSAIAGDIFVFKDINGKNKRKCKINWENF